MFDPKTMLQECASSFQKIWQHILNHFIKLKILTTTAVDKIMAEYSEFINNEFKLNKEAFVTFDCNAESLDTFLL